jgi:hypothetical protein
LPRENTETCCIQIESAILPNAGDMQEEAYKRHQEVLDIIETLSETSSSEGASTVNNLIAL